MTKIKAQKWSLLFCLLVFAGNAAAGGLTPEQKDRVAGFLGMDLYVYETTLVGTPEEFQNTVSDHLDYQVMLEEKGIMFGAGPIAEEGQPGHPTSGLIIIRAKSFEEAKAIADADPFHARGIRTYKLRHWTLNEGRIDFSIGISDQKAIIK